MIVLAFRS